MAKRQKKSKRNKRKKGAFAPSAELQREDIAPALISEDEHERVIELSPVMQELLIDQLEKFRQKFGRAPGPDDPIFFDPDADEPLPLPEDYLEEAMTEAGHEAGIREAQVYAMRKTALLIVDGLNDHLVSKEDRAAWEAAIDEFEAMS